MPTFASTFFLAVCCLAALPAAAQSRLPPGARGPDTAMATRSVSHYLMLERRLQDALASHDDAGLGALLDADFAARAAAKPDAMARDAWLAGARRDAGRVRDLSVREIDDLAIVTYLLDHARGAGAAHRTDFVVDVWRRSTDHLLSRSTAAAAHAPPAPSRPDGRE